MTRGVVGFNSAYNTMHFFPVWKIGGGTWNTVCTVINTEQHYYKTIINGETVYENNEYDVDIIEKEEGFSIMGEISQGKYKIFFLCPSNRCQCVEQIT